jgi:GNAT superfamily N-acetyltransferase
MNRSVMAPIDRWTLIEQSMSRPSCRQVSMSIGQGRLAIEWETRPMETAHLSTATDDLRSGDLADFFVGWPQSPSLEDRLGILVAADEVVIARDGDGVVIGFATAITDYRFAAFIPLVEVLPQHQRSGIGSQMLRALLARLGTCYMIDLVCDDDVVPFYERLGGTRLNAMVWRHRDRLRADDE